MPLPLLLPLFLGALSHSTPLQESEALFDAPMVMELRNTMAYRRLLDFDGDGDLDALAIGETVGNDFTSSIELNDGTGTFKSVSYGYYLPKMNGPLAVEVGDIDGDGVDEYMVARGTRMWVGDILGARPYPGNDLYLSGVVEAAAFADLNSDGSDEIILALDNGIEVHFNSGQVLTLPFSFSHPVSAVRTLDADGDGLGELVLASPGKVTIFYQAPGICGAKIVIPHSFSGGTMDVGDIDGDGDMDIVVFDDQLGNEYHVIRNNESCDWTLEPRALGGPAEFLRDVDGDGDLDGVCCGGSYQNPPLIYNYPSPFQIAINDGTGNFAPSFQVPGMGSPQLCGVADVDGDGDIDLVSGRVVYYADGPISSDHARGLSALPFRPTPRDVVDFDGDGDPDLRLTANSVFVNDGSGNFVETIPDMPVPPRGTKWVKGGMPGDFDGDGDIDLLVEHRSMRKLSVRNPAAGTGDPGLIGMRLLLNNGFGNFTDGGPASMPGVTFAIRNNHEMAASLVVDLDGDGLMDLVTRSMSPPVQSRFWTNTGNGVFEGPMEISDARAEYVGDINGDGIVDMIACTLDPVLWVPRYYKIALFHGFKNGSGQTNFAVVPGQDNIWSTDPFRYPMAFGDLTDSGYVDMAITDRRASNTTLVFDTRVYGGSGYGAQAALFTYLLPGAGATSTFGDLNNDQLTDIVSGPVLNELAGVMEVHRKISSPYKYYSFSQLMAPGILLDINGDGRLELVGKGGINFLR